MKRPRIKTAKRPLTASGAVARTRKEAAMQLVRIEFDASRLKMAAEQAEERAATHREELSVLEKRRAAILAALNDRRS